MSTEQPQLQASDFNLQQVSTKQYAELLMGAIHTRTNLAIFGRRGSGKTEIAKQCISDVWINNHKPVEVYINLSVAERTDMAGYPDMFRATQFNDDKVERFVNFMLPKFFQPLMEGDQPAIVVFDEVDKADTSICAPLLEILQFGSINGKKLKNMQACILTGNLISEGSSRPSLPLLDRAEKYLLKPDTNAWLEWAGKSGEIHPSIAAFLNDKAQYLYGAEDGGGDNYADPSPRSWHNASKVIFAGEKLGWSKDLLHLKVAGFVGKTAGLEYDIYFTHYQELLPLVDAVFKGERIDSILKQKSPSTQLYTAMIVCSRLSGMLAKAEKENPPPELNYVGKFMQHLAPENVLVSVRAQLGINNLVKWKLDSHKDWKEPLRDVVKQVNVNH